MQLSSKEIVQVFQIYTNKRLGSNGTVVEEQEIPTYASSVPVPKVQEMVREDPLNVPERYIRNHKEMLISTDKIHLSSEVPVIDLSLLSNANEDELKKPDLACKDWGFFRIWSNVRNKSIEHRAVTNENKSRLSFASYLVPLDDVEVKPFAHIVESHGSKRMYKKVKYGDYLRQSMNRKMEGKAHTQMAKNET